jgi:hypothetical protein
VVVVVCLASVVVVAGFGTGVVVIGASFAVQSVASPALM